MVELTSVSRAGARSPRQALATSNHRASVQAIGQQLLETGERSSPGSNWPYARGSWLQLVLELEDLTQDETTPRSAVWLRRRGAARP
jgi:hypothetical protein